MRNQKTPRGERTWPKTVLSAGTARFSGALLLLAASQLMGCGSGQEIVRSHDGITESGRYIPSRSYAWYSRARELHRQGRLSAARRAYERALSSDPESGSAWAGLAETFCLDDAKRAKETFDRGLKQAAERAPLYLSRARCQLDWNHPAKALLDAERALALDPEWPAATELAVASLLALGRSAEAQRLQSAFALFSPETIEGAPSLSTTQFNAPPFNARLSTPPSGPDAAPDLAAIDRALGRNDIDKARRLATGSLPASMLALRALALGKDQLALEQARVVAGADPSNTDAFIALLVLGDRNLRPPTPEAEDTSPLGACLMTEHLLRHTGREGARAYAHAVGLSKQTDDQDELTSSCITRTMKHL